MEDHHEMFFVCVCVCVWSHRIKTQESIAAVHLNDLLMMTIVFRYVRYADFSLIVSIETCKDVFRQPQKV